MLQGTKSTAVRVYHSRVIPDAFNSGWASPEECQAPDTAVLERLVAGVEVVPQSGQQALD
jgi:hypothetical protein